MTAADELRSRERVVTFRLAERTRRADELARASSRLELARETVERAAAALSGHDLGPDESAAPRRAGELLAIVARRDEARARRARLARALDEAKRALADATEARDAASRALALAERRLEAARDHAEEIRRRARLTREERALEDATEMRRR